jgi:polar amino acid transport system substrate-binding protein
VTRRRTVAVVTGVLAVAALAGCAASSNAASESSKRALVSSTTTTIAPTPTTPPKECSIETQPPMDLPPPGDMPAGSYMATIQANHFLRVGVDENTIGFAMRDPQSGKLDGFEIKLVDEIARAIFGDPSKIKYISVVTNDKVDVVADGTVDLTASTVSITKQRACKVAFSSEYFTTPQRVMVSARSNVRQLSDLVGDKVCVTKGSTTTDLVQRIGAVPYPVETRTDCLVALQQGDVDGIASHETILRGLHQQDPKNTRILLGEGDTLPGDQQHYGVAIAKSHPELVSFVNGVLEQLRANHKYDQLYTQYVAPLYKDTQNSVVATGGTQ